MCEQILVHFKDSKIVSYTLPRRGLEKSLKTPQDGLYGNYINSGCAIFGQAMQFFEKNDKIRDKPGMALKSNNL